MDYLFYAQTFLFQLYCIILLKVINKKLDNLNYIENEYIEDELERDKPNSEESSFLTKNEPKYNSCSDECNSCGDSSKKSLNDSDESYRKKVIKIESSDDEEIEKISKEEEIDILNSFKSYEGEHIELCEKYLKSCNYKLIVVIENKINKDYDNKYDEYKIFAEVKDNKIIKFLSIGEYFPQ